MFEQFGSKLFLSDEDEKRIDSIFNDLEVKYQGYSDPWGLDLSTCKKAFKIFLPIYKHYFKVRIFGKENVKDIPYMVVSNHSGQIPIDGLLIALAFVWEFESPRILRGMIEKFMVNIPFLGDLTAQTGSILGDRKNCQFLIENGESIMAFPEGVRGVSKNTKDFYKLQHFTHGFFRLALQNDIDILPVAVPFCLSLQKTCKVT
jgi:1-acyl-sn-glycerol-3-phosphate acyltransferase